MKLIKGNYIKVKKYIKNKFTDDYFEFNFPYVDEKAPFKEINRFIDESKMKTRFKNKYLGNVVINITEWVDDTPNKYFDAFMYFILDRELESNKNKTIFTCEKECSTELTKKLNEFFEDIKIIDLGLKNKNAKHTIGFVCDSNQENYREV